MDLFIMTLTCKQNWNNLQTSLVFTFKAGQRSSCLQMASQLPFLEKCNSQEKIKGPLYGADQILEKVRILSSPLLKTFTLALCQGTVPMLLAKSSKVPPHPPLDVQTTIPCWEFIWMATGFWWFPPKSPVHMHVSEALLEESLALTFTLYLIKRHYAVFLNTLPPSSQR